jgi:hypothetical protein
LGCRLYNGIGSWTRHHHPLVQVVIPIKMSEPEQIRRVISLSASTYYYTDFLKEVEEEIQKKAFLVNAGLDKFSKAEIFAYWALHANGYFFVEPEQANHDLPDQAAIAKPS